MMYRIHKYKEKTYQLCGTRCGSTAASEADAATSIKDVVVSNDKVGTGNFSPTWRFKCLRWVVSVAGGFGATHSPTLADV